MMPWGRMTEFVLLPLRYSLALFRGSTISPSPRQLVVITGCDSGLGYSLSVKCQELGISVVSGCLNVQSPGATRLQATCDVKELDVTHPASVARFADDVRSLINEKQFELHAVVNNAGVLVFGEFEWLTEEQTLQQVNVNLLGSFRVAKAFLPLLRKHKGRLINMTSHCALSSLPALSVYASTKAALHNWSEALRIEQSQYGVKVISFMPGSFIQQTNIMSRQSQYAKEMDAAMTAEDKEVFGEYFREFNNYLGGVRGSSELTCIKNEDFYDKFTKALLDTSPAAFYKSEPWRQRRRTSGFVIQDLGAFGT